MQIAKSQEKKLKTALAILLNEHIWLIHSWTNSKKKKTTIFSPQTHRLRLTLKVEWPIKSIGRSAVCSCWCSVFTNKISPYVIWNWINKLSCYCICFLDNFVLMYHNRPQKTLAATTTILLQYLMDIDTAVNLKRCDVWTELVQWDGVAGITRTAYLGQFRSFCP